MGSILGVTALLILVVVPVVDARVERALWDKCGRRDPVRVTQHQITSRKSHIR